MRFVLSAALLLSVSVPAMAAPPRSVPLDETVHGVALSDEYRWMEDVASEVELRTWMLAEAAKTRTALDAMPERTRFVELLKESNGGITRRYDVQTAGGTTLYRMARPGDQQPKLYAVVDGKERVLIDPSAVEGGQAIGSVSLSPDGKLVGVHLSSGGSEVGAAQIYDVATGAKVGAPFERMWGEDGVVWLGDNMVATGRLSAEGEYADPLMGGRAFVRKIDGSDTIQIAGPGIDNPLIKPSEFPMLWATPKEKWAMMSGGSARADWPMWITPLADVRSGKARWMAVGGMEDKLNGATVKGDNLFLQTTKTNSAGSILRREIGADGLGAPKSVFEGRDDLIITHLASGSDGVYVRGHKDGVTRIFWSRTGDAPFTELPMPFAGGDVAYFSRNADGRGISFATSGWGSNARTFRAVDGKLSESSYRSDSWAPAAEFTVDALQAKSADGTMVPLMVVRPKGAVPSGGVPTILEGYGGYGISTATPFYNRMGAAWVARGGAYAYCGTRGGGERGRAWHEGGRGPNKANAHADFIACAETLKAKGIATAAGPVATGGSMGGTLVPPAVLKRPDLFAAMVPAVGIVNPTRIGAAINGANQFDEMGDPNDPVKFKDLVAMDAYQMLPGAKTMPPTMVMIGLNDKRVAPWMSAKFTARAQAKWPDAKIWLNADDATGHGIGSGEDARLSQAADIYAFAWSQASAK